MQAPAEVISRGPLTTYENRVLSQPMKDDVARETANRVRQAMTAAGVRQISLAEVLGISQAQVSQRLTGNVDFTITELTRVAELLGLPVADLLPAPASR
jgi:predicted XRE-type DNA-binding protein